MHAFITLGNAAATNSPSIPDPYPYHSLILAQILEHHVPNQRRDDRDRKVRHRKDVVERHPQRLPLPVRVRKLAHQQVGVKQKHNKRHFDHGAQHRDHLRSLAGPWVHPTAIIPPAQAKPDNLLRKHTYAHSDQRSRSWNPPSASASKRYFEFARLGTNWRTEILAGVTTFLTMAYIVLVNPAISPTPACPLPAVTAATCLSAAFGSILMGVVARYPIALAPGMGLNAYFTYTVCIKMHIPWQTALGAVFLSGIIFLASPPPASAR